MLFIISSKHSILLSRVFAILRISTANDKHLYKFKQKFNKKLEVISNFWILYKWNNDKYRASKVKK